MADILTESRKEQEAIESKGNVVKVVCPMCNNDFLVGCTDCGDAVCCTCGGAGYVWATRWQDR